LLAFLRELQGCLPDARRQYSTKGIYAVQVMTAVIVPEELSTDLLYAMIVSALSGVFFLVSQGAAEMHA
jgi:hypothetical protein